MIRNGQWILLSGLLFLVQSCGYFPTGDSTPQLYSLDGVKLISESITNELDPSSFKQANYSIAPKSRLLLRFESLNAHVSKIQISPEKRVTVEITLSNSADQAEAVSHLNLCPITRTWMMRATWKYAHPFGSNGGWPHGGSVDSDGCVSPTAKPEDATSKVLTFDMTQWFIDYPRGRNVNYGLILISEVPISIIGEVSGTYSPRIRFEKFPTWETNGNRN